MNYKLIHTPLCGEDIIKKIPGCKFILYEDMWKVNSLEQLLPCTLILYELARVGHFCSVFINKEGINFFDPLGSTGVDTELQMVDPKLVHKLHQDFPYLEKLIYESGVPEVIYNEFPLQEHKTSTCGDWNFIRLLCRSLTNDEFNSVFKKFKPLDRDIIVAKLYKKY